MEQEYGRLKKEEYAKELAQNGQLDKAKEIIMKDDFLPILTPVEIHAETEIESSDINSILKDIDVDLDIVGKEMSMAASNFKDLIESTRLKLNNIKTILRTEKERQEDINILCNKYTDFSSVILASDKNVTTKLQFSDNAFSIPASSSKDVKYEIISITGNGYEGNKYVYKNNEFYNSVSDTSNRKYINDNSIITYYEYSRITANNSEKEVFPLVNFDSVNARCAILIKADDSINNIQITMETDDVILESLSTSIDGQSFKESSIKNIAINNKKDRFNSEGYIYGCGILSFKDCNYVKLVLRANSNSSDEIAFVKKDDDNETVIKLNSAKRSVIKINDIKVGKNIYSSNGNLVFNDFITDPVASIAIFANEYAADEINIREAIKYTLTVNGIDYNVVPINSNYNGKKVVRTTSRSIPAEHVHYLNETIKNATLTVDFKTSKQYATPYISDLKILIGGE